VNRVTGSAESLPIEADSLDVVVLPHVLEFADNPHKVLREVERALIGDGCLLLFGFNPWSLWGLWRLALAWRDDPPWCGYFYRLSRIRDWLNLLDLEVVRVERLAFRPPLGNRRVMHRLRVFEYLGRHIWPAFGGAYMVLAKKRVVPLTLVPRRWNTRRGMVAPGVVEPSARKSGSGA
jgi:SAM-dependent methyltransferase